MATTDQTARREPACAWSLLLLGALLGLAGGCDDDGTASTGEAIVPSSSAPPAGTPAPETAPPTPAAPAPGTLPTNTSPVPVTGGDTDGVAGAPGMDVDGGAADPDGGSGSAPGPHADAATGMDAGHDTGDAGTGECTPPQPGTMGSNPLMPDGFTADPAPMVHDCTFYIACGHDEGTTGFFLREWYLLSSTDLVNWERTVAFGVDLFSWARANAWAGQMVEKDGTFYWYVPVAKHDGTMAIGVARAEHPTGPFVDAIGGPLIDDDFEMSNMGFAQPADTPYTIDPTVFVDDDGQAYLHYGSFFRMVNARLGDDMVSIQGTMVESTPQGFFEAPFLTKRNGIYYEVYARDGNPAKIDYATSDSPMGPWQYGGRILDPLPNNPGEDAATSHPGVAEFAGEWYLVYHLSHGTAGTYRRQVAMEKLTFNADGSIQKVSPSSGLAF